MDQSGLVCLAERTEQGAQDRCRRVGGHRAALVEEFTQGAAGDEFHDQERGLSLDALVEDLDYPGVGQSGGGARLEGEAVDEGTVPGELWVEEFDGHVTVESLIGGQMDDGHPAASDHGVQPVPPVEQGARPWNLPVMSAHVVHSAPPVPVAVCPAR